MLKKGKKKGNVCTTSIYLNRHLLNKIKNLKYLNMSTQR